MSGKKQPQQVPDYTGLSLQTSSMVSPVPYAGGLVRCTPNLIYYTDYTVHNHSSKGGKGGGGKTKTQTYSATIILAICEGPITTITKTWVNQGFVSGFTDPGFLLFTGTIPQAPWSYLVTAHPQDAFGYQGICYTAAKNYDLGATPTVPQHSFEVQAPNYNTGYTGAGDADCALEVQRFLTNPEYGALFPSAFLDTTSYDGGSLLSGPNATTTGDGAYQTYCRANGWGISPFINNQESAATVIARWLQITNTAPVWTGYSIKFIPYGDATITGHGVTYNPPTGTAFEFTDDDYIQTGNDDPIEISLTDWFDASNALVLEVKDRTQNYDTVPIDVIDQSQNELIGRRPASTVQAHEICYLPMAFQVASLLEQRMAYVRLQYKFKVGPQYSALEPMDCGTATETYNGVVYTYGVRIRDIEEQDDGSLELTCEEFTGTLGQHVAQTTQGGSRAYNNQQVVPAPVNDPIIFEPNVLAAQRLNNGSSVPIVCILASGGTGGVNDPNWGGCIINVSSDGGTTYGPIGKIEVTANQGALTANLASYGGANPDVTNTLSVNLAESNGTLAGTSTAADAANGVTLGIVQDGVCSNSFELLDPETATLVSGNSYNLTNLYRGLYATTAGAHTTGALYGRLDDATFIFPLPAAYIGVALKFKFQSFNTFGNQTQDISTCTVYTYTPPGVGYGGGSGGIPSTPTTPVGTTTQIGQITWTWAQNPSTDNVTGYEFWTAPGPGGAFGSATKRADLSGDAGTFTLSGLGTLVDLTGFVIAKNVVGSSAHSLGGDGITSSIAVAGEQPFGFTASVFDISSRAGKTIRIAVDVNWTFPATTSTPAGSVSGKVAVGPSINTDFDLQKDGVSIGTARFTGSGTTATLIKAADTSFTNTDYLDIVIPANLNGMSGPWSLALGGIRP